MSLLDRCKQFMKTKMPGGSAWGQDLADFVHSEIGRASDDRLGDSAPLVLYFDNGQDRQEFLDTVMAAKPNWISRKWP